MSALRRFLMLGVLVAAAASADGRLHGAAIDVLTRKPVGGVRITLQGPALKAPITAVTNERGYFLLGAPEGDYVLRAESGEWYGLERGVRILNDATVRADAELCALHLNCADIIYPRHHVDIMSSAIRVNLAPFLPARRPGIARSPPLVPPKAE